MRRVIPIHPNLLCSLWENGRRGLSSCHPMWPVIALKVHTVVGDGAGTLHLLNGITREGRWCDCGNGRDRGPKWSSLADGRTDGSGDPERSSTEDAPAVSVSDSAGLCDVPGRARTQTPDISEEVPPTDGVQICRVAHNHLHFMSRVQPKGASCPRKHSEPYLASHLGLVGPLLPPESFGVGGRGWPVRRRPDVISSVSFIPRGSCHHVCSTTT